MVIGQELELRLDHFEAGLAARRLHFAIQGDHLPALKFVLQVRAVEPHAFDLAQALFNGHLENGHAPRTHESDLGALGR